MGRIKADFISFKEGLGLDQIIGKWISKIKKGIKVKQAKLVQEVKFKTWDGLSEWMGFFFFLKYF